MTNNKFWGHIISENGIATDPEKIAVVKKWPELKSVHQVQQFMGLVNYYRDHVQGMAAIRQAACMSKIFTPQENRWSPYDKLHTWEGLAVADPLSRRPYHEDVELNYNAVHDQQCRWALHPELLAQISKQHGPFDVDGFKDERIAQLEGEVTDFCRTPLAGKHT